MPESDKHVNYLYSITPEWSQVRIKEMITD